MGRILLLLVAAGLLGGCAGLLPGQKQDPARTYLLAPAAPGAPGAIPAHGKLTILVSHPEAAAGYGTFRMAYLERDYRIDYFGYSEWVDTPAALIRPLLVGALRASGGFQAVTDDGRSVDADLRLDLVLLEIHQDFQERPSRGTVALRAQLIDLEGRRVVDTRTFRGTEPAPTEDAYGGVVAVNRVLTRLLPDVARFAVSAASKLKGGQGGRG